MKIAIIVREETLLRCTAGGCMNAFSQRIDSFARYADQEDVELVAFTHDGGDIEKKVAVLQKKGVDVVHLSSCIRGKGTNYEPLAKRLSEHFAVVGYTHGEEIGNTGPAIILAKAADNLSDMLSDSK
jgi:predicted metal-binding protein